MTDSVAQPKILPSEADSSIQAHRFAHKAMATIFEIICVHEDRPYAEQAALAAFDLIDRLETELTCHRSSSDISRINHLEAGGAVTVGMWTLECLLMAQHFFHETGGAFDISLGSGLGGIELFPSESRVGVRAGGVRLDLGGIGKGYAIDRAGELLNEWEVNRAIIHGGFSSVLVLEPPPGREGWPLTISLPAVDLAPVLARITAAHQCWSASGIFKKDHIVDPRTGIPVRNRPAVWVCGRLESLAAAWRREEAAGLPPEIFETGASPSAVAEALSTAFMVLSLDEIAGVCLRYPGVEARVLTSDPSNPLLRPVMTHLTHVDHPGT
jgi:thiamine biosynthesis lipoprotein